MSNAERVKNHFTGCVLRQSLMGGRLAFISGEALQSPFMRYFFIGFGLIPTAVCVMLATDTWPNWRIPAGGVFLAVSIVLCSMIGALGISEPRRPPENYSPGGRALLVWFGLVLLDAAILFARFGISSFLPGSP
jgi:hypothetical protein